jgi:hypothetical protein
MHYQSHTKTTPGSGDSSRTVDLVSDASWDKEKKLTLKAYISYECIWQGHLQGHRRKVHCRYPTVTRFKKGSDQEQTVFTLKPVGHQSTNWMVFFVLMVATADWTSLGTTSPR